MFIIGIIHTKTLESLLILNLNKIVTNIFQDFRDLDVFVSSEVAELPLATSHRLRNPHFWYVRVQWRNSPLPANAGAIS